MAAHGGCLPRGEDTGCPTRRWWESGAHDGAALMHVVHPRVDVDPRRPRVDVVAHQRHERRLDAVLLQHVSGHLQRNLVQGCLVEVCLVSFSVFACKVDFHIGCLQGLRGGWLRRCWVLIDGRQALLTLIRELLPKHPSIDGGLLAIRLDGQHLIEVPQGLLELPLLLQSLRAVHQHSSRAVQVQVSHEVFHVLGAAACGGQVRDARRTIPASTSHWEGDWGELEDCSSSCQDCVAN
mmetsp:Transcript_84802/g.263801  ORF Transcript_84802/g.263801 Transcript_84802/m.263801 type:complete len:237 (+) Transcript_84802:305-1015(+)